MALTMGRSARIAAALMAAAAMLSACAPSSQTRYQAGEIGRPLAVEFATILATRPVRIEGNNSGVGGAVGAAAGGLALSPVGQGVGRAAAVLGGAVAGLALGALAEQGLSNRDGVEYTLTLESGETLTIVQNIGRDDVVLAPGDRAMVQFGRGYQRVLPAGGLPTRVARPEGVAVYDLPPDRPF